MNASSPRVSIVIPCHSEHGWDALVNAITSARSQQPPPAEVVVVVDHNPKLYYRIRRDLIGVTVLHNELDPGASGTRNTGARHVTTELVAFLDGDTTANRQWLAHLVRPFEDPSVVGTGGAITPAWPRTRPHWLPDELLWTVGASYAGMPASTTPVRDVRSASMVVRRDVFAVVGGFRDDSGRAAHRKRPEDTDLCLRMSGAGGLWIYVPGAVVAHDVPRDRSTFAFVLRRCFTEGRAKARRARLPDRPVGPDTERAEFAHPRPGPVLPGLTGAVLGPQAGQPGRTSQAARAGTVVAAVTAAAAGGAVETLRAWRSRGPATAGADR